MIAETFDALAERPLWVLWKTVARDGKPTKVPFTDRRPEGEARPTPRPGARGPRLSARPRTTTAWASSWRRSTNRTSRRHRSRRLHR